MKLIPKAQAANVPPPMPASQEFFCHREDGELIHLLRSKLAVKTCGAGEVISATVRPAAEGEIPTHWGWFDHEEACFSMVFRTRQRLAVCFHYGIEAEEKRGRGKATPLIAEVVPMTLDSDGRTRPSEDSRGRMRPLEDSCQGSAVGER